MVISKISALFIIFVVTNIHSYQINDTDSSHFDARISPALPYVMAHNPIKRRLSPQSSQVTKEFSQENKKPTLVNITNTHSYRFQYTYTPEGDLESEYIQILQDSTWRHHQLVTYQYISDSNTIVQTIIEWFHPEGWKNRWRTTFVFNNAGLQTERMLENGYDQDWRPRERYKYNFNLANKPVDSVYQYWGGPNDWRTEDSAWYNYNAEGRLAQKKIFFRMAGVLTQIKMYTYDYDNSGRLIEFQDLSVVNGSYSKFARFTYHYLNDKPDSIIRWIGNNQQEWVLYKRFRMEYNENMNIKDSSVDNYSQTQLNWLIDSRYKYEYFPSGLLKTKTYETSNGDTLVFSNRFHFEYDPVGRRILDSIQYWSSAWLPNITQHFIFDIRDNLLYSDYDYYNSGGTTPRREFEKRYIVDADGDGIEASYLRNSGGVMVPDHTFMKIYFNNRSSFYEYMASVIYVDYSPITGIKQETSPAVYYLHQNYPNPFNPSTVLTFTLPQSSHVRLDIYDITGRKIQTLVNENLQPGTHTAEFNASAFSSGVYFARLTAGGYVKNIKMLFMK